MTQSHHQMTQSNTSRTAFAWLIMLLAVLLTAACANDPAPAAPTVAAATEAVEEVASADPTQPVALPTPVIQNDVSGGDAGAGREGGTPPNLAAAAAQLGVSEQALRDALGPPPPDFAVAAEALGISADVLRAAMQAAGAPPPDAPPDALAQPEETEPVVDEPLAASVSAECPATHFLDVQAHPANAAYPDPELMVTCDGATFTVSSNGIPSFEFVTVSPRDLVAKTYNFPISLMPTALEIPVDIVNSIGPLGILIDGLPIFGPNEAANLGWGDPYLDGVLDACNGHVGGQGDYHVHAKPDCLIDIWETPNAVLGYGLDGFPILTPFVCADAACNTLTELRSSWQRTQDVVAAWEAHEYVAGSGDLDECNGMWLADGTYAYFATATFPYFFGCMRGQLPVMEGPAGGPPQGGGEGQQPQGGGNGQQPPQGGGGGRGGPPDLAAAAEQLGITEQALRDALGPPPPNFEAAAQTLGITVEELQNALGGP